MNLQMAFNVNVNVNVHAKAFPHKLILFHEI